MYGSMKIIFQFFVCIRYMLIKQSHILQGLKKLQAEIAVFEKQKTDELERLEQFREEEMRKLRYVFIAGLFQALSY